MPHRRDKMPIMPSQMKRPDGGVGAVEYDKYIDEYDGYHPTDFDEIEEGDVDIQVKSASAVTEEDIERIVSSNETLADKSDSVRIDMQKNASGHIQTNNEAISLPTFDFDDSEFDDYLAQDENESNQFSHAQESIKFEDEHCDIDNNADATEYGADLEYEKDNIEDDELYDKNYESDEPNEIGIEIDEDDDSDEYDEYDDEEYDDEYDDEDDEDGLDDDDAAEEEVRELVEKRARLDRLAEEGTALSEDLFDECFYESVPKIPQQYRGSDIIGKRTQASTASVAISLGKINNKGKLRDIWATLTDVEKYILMLISEHRHMTQAQLGSLIIPASSRKKAKGGKGGFDATKTYFEWVTDIKHLCPLDYKSTFKTGTQRGLAGKLKSLVELELIEEVIPAYSVAADVKSDSYKRTPALFTHHYYLTPMGAKVLIVNTDVNRNTSKVKPVGYVPTYKNAAYQTILHEAESTEVMCSLVSCAQYASNPDDNLHDFGIFDICRFYHEKDIEEKGVTYRGKKIDFKPDGKLTMYVDSIGDFIDWYIEYDAGSSKVKNLTHKAEAFIKYIFWQREKYGERFRKPVLLLVTQKPADFFPQLVGKTKTTYTTAIKNMAHEHFEEYLSILNDVAIILVADCGSIREHGALGACWHKMDLTTGIADTKAYDIITASKDISKAMKQRSADASTHQTPESQQMQAQKGQTQQQSRPQQQQSQQQQTPQQEQSQQPLETRGELDKEERKRRMAQAQQRRAMQERQMRALKAQQQKPREQSS